MKVKLDENLPASLGAVLAARGHDTDSVLSEGLLGREDIDMAGAAKAAGRMLFTLDKGFGDIRAYPPGSHPGIVVLRLADESAAQMRQVVTNLVDQHPLDGLSGALVVVQRGRVRVRWAP